MKKFQPSQKTEHLAKAKVLIPITAMLKLKKIKITTSYKEIKLKSH